MITLGVNGTGRIGLCAIRVCGERQDVKLGAVNTTMPIETLVHLLAYDSVHGKFSVAQTGEDTFSIGHQKNIKVLSSREPSELPFGELGVKVILECTGAFNELHKASKHLHGGVQKVVISAPAKETPTFVCGVNHKEYKGENVISNASCTTNCLAPIAKVLDENFSIKNALMTTIHSYTNDQNLLDSKHKDVRRARAAACSMIPTSTGAAKAVGLVLPNLVGKFSGIAIRVPTPCVSLVDLSCEFEKEISKEAILEAFNKASKEDMQGIIDIDNNKLVSSDFVGSCASAIFIPDCVNVLGKHHAKVMAWYDNEWGYSQRLVDLAHYIAKF